MAVRALLTALLVLGISTNGADAVVGNALYAAKHAAGLALDQFSAAISSPPVQGALRELDEWVDHMDGMSYAQKYLCVREKYKQAQELVIEELVAPVGSALGTDDCFDSWGKFASTRCERVRAAYAEYIGSKNAFSALPMAKSAWDAASNGDVVETKVWTKQGARPSWAPSYERKKKGVKNLKISAGIMAVTALADYAMLQRSGWNTPPPGCVNSCLTATIRQRCSANFDMDFKGPEYRPLTCKEAFPNHVLACDREGYNRCAAPEEGGECFNMWVTTMAIGSGQDLTCPSSDEYFCGCQDADKSWRATAFTQISPLGTYTNHVCKRNDEKTAVVRYSSHSNDGPGQCDWAIPNKAACVPAARMLGYIVENDAPTELRNVKYPFGCFVTLDSVGRPTVYWNMIADDRYDSTTGKHLWGTLGHFADCGTQVPRKDWNDSDSTSRSTAHCICSNLDPMPPPTPAPPPPADCLNYDMSDAFGPKGTGQFLDKTYWGNYGGLTSPGQATCTNRRAGAGTGIDASTSDCGCPQPHEPPFKMCGLRVGRTKALDIRYTNDRRGLEQKAYKWPQYNGTATNYFCGLHPCTSGAHNCAGSYAPNNYLRKRGCKARPGYDGTTTVTLPSGSTVETTCGDMWLNAYQPNCETQPECYWVPNDEENDFHSTCVNTLSSSDKWSGISSTPMEASFKCECEPGYVMDGTWLPELNAPPSYNCVKVTTTTTTTTATTTTTTTTTTPGPQTCMSCMPQNCDASCVAANGRRCVTSSGTLCFTPDSCQGSHDACQTTQEHICQSRSSYGCTWGKPVWAATSYVVGECPIATCEPIPTIPSPITPVVCPPVLLAFCLCGTAYDANGCRSGCTPCTATTTTTTAAVITTTDVPTTTTTTTTTWPCPPVTTQACLCGRVIGSGNCPSNTCAPCTPPTTTAPPCGPITLQYCPCGRAWVGNCPGGCKPCPPPTTTTTTFAPQLSDNTFFKPADLPHCHVGADGNSVIQWSRNHPLHKSFACHIFGNVCACSRHPTHHTGNCMQVTKTGEHTIHIGGDCGATGSDTNCGSPPISMNGPSRGSGCSGAVWMNGQPSKRYCDGDHKVAGDTLFPWWGHCCKWDSNANSCVPKSKPASCQGVRDAGEVNSGEYEICPGGPDSCFTAYCHMDGSHGWTLVATRGGKVESGDSRPHIQDTPLTPQASNGGALSQVRFAPLLISATNFMFQSSHGWGAGPIGRLTHGNSCTNLSIDLTKCSLVHTETDGCAFGGHDYCSVMGVEGGIGTYEDECNFFRNHNCPNTLWTSGTAAGGFYATWSDLYVR